MAEVGGGIGAASQVQPPLPPYPPPPEEPPPPKMPYVGEPIALALGVDYPFPPHLEYAYPPPDGNILTNVVNALIAVPRFYTQVLHLMNKMNLPAPFRPALPTPPLPPARPPEPTPAPQPPPYQQRDLSSGESELESSDEDKEAENVDHDSVRSTKKQENSRKRRKLEAVLGPAGDKDASHEAAGVKSVTLTAKEAPTVKKKQPVLQIRIASRGVAGDPIQENRKELVESPEDVPVEVQAKQPLTATRDELLAGMVPHTELLTQAAFKNYTPGNPTQVLYIKNLAKDVTVQDLYYIYGAFFPAPEEARSALTVKLMQEGRMRGQAFVTFPTSDLAADALNMTNGFSLKGKPMIVQFGRNPSAGKASNS